MSSSHDTDPDDLPLTPRASVLRGRNENHSFRHRHHVLTRQAVPTIDRSKYASASGVARGAYVLADAADGKPDVLLLASGSEVALCLEAYGQLKAEGIRARVVSMPSWEPFDDQPQDYRDRVLPPEVTAGVSVEQASTFGWSKYVGATGHSIGMRSFAVRRPEGPGQEVWLHSRTCRGRRQGTAQKEYLMTIIERALEWVQNGSRIGLGSGRAAQAFVKALGERVRAGACTSTGSRPRRRPPTSRCRRTSRF